MSPVDRPIPPTGEEVHLPGGSLQPLLLTVGITLALIGVTWKDPALYGGLVLTAGVLIWWIRDAVREFQALPSDHGEH